MYLKEVQGFRFVAALLVAIYHIWFHQVSGGVDAFFVIGGFFLFQGMLRKDVLKFGDIRVYWRRTLARIVPTASVVILATCILFAFLGTELLTSSRIKSAVAAIFFVENWWLAHEGADYLTVGETPSPFQQLWALSVQLQIYFLLPPIVYLVITALRKRDRFDLAAGIFGSLLLAAFAYAVLRTHVNQPTAYFDTFARVWEFLAGGLLALLLPRLAIGPGAAKILGYLSLAVLVSFAAVVPVSTSFPGMTALVPVLATAGIIVSSRNGAGLAILNNAPMQRLGDISFTFYLWHWPIYLFVWDRTGTPDVSILAGFLIIILSLALAFLTFRLFETPLRSHGYLTNRLATAVICCMVTLVSPAAFAAAWGAVYMMDKRQAEKDIAATIRTGTAARLVPSPLLAKTDYSVTYDDDCHQMSSKDSEVVSCEYGNAGGSWTVALVGGSHTLQWLPALREVARTEQDMRIVVFAKTGCTFTTLLDGIHIGSDRAACLEWNRGVIDEVVELDPDLIVTTATRVHDGEETIPEGYRQAWRTVGNIRILAIRDNPRAPFDIAACVDRLGAEAPSCDAVKPVFRDTTLVPDELGAQVTLADYSDFFCQNDRCPAVRNNILIYRDAHHITATAARILASRLRLSLADVRAAN